jgi:hypothetical protein
MMLLLLTAMCKAQRGEYKRFSGKCGTITALAVLALADAALFRRLQLLPALAPLK